MPTTKVELFLSGKKKADLSVVFTKPKTEELQKLTPEQKREVREFFKQAERALQAFARGVMNG